WIENSGSWRPLVVGVAIPSAAAIVCLLGYVIFAPILGRFRVGRPPMVLPDTAGGGSGGAPVYRRVLRPLGSTALDRLALSHGAAMAKLHDATLYLLHVEEGVTSQLYGKEASTAEVEAGEQYLERIAQDLRNLGVRVETAISHSSSPKREIVRY